MALRRLVLLLLSIAVISFLCQSLLWAIAFTGIGIINFKSIKWVTRNGWSPRGYYTLLLIHSLPLFYTKLAPIGLAPLPITGSLAFVLLSLSFLFDLNSGRIEKLPTIFDYLLYVIYFPRFFFGPFDRFNSFIAEARRQFEWSWRRIVTGFFLIASGIFKKLILIAGPAKISSAYFRGELPVSGAVTMAVMYLSTLEVYSLFSGYTDLMRGISLLLGIELPINFRFPLFAKNPQDFWKRWHVSFHLWLRDYVFFRAFNRLRSIFASVFLTFVLMGFTIGYRFESKFIIIGVFCGMVTAIHISLMIPLEKWQLRLQGYSQYIYRLIAHLAVLHFICIGLFLHRVPNANFILETARSLFKFNWQSANQLVIPLVLIFTPIIALDILLYRKNGDESKLTGAEFATAGLIIFVFSAVHFHLYWPISKELFYFLLYRKS